MQKLTVCRAATLQAHQPAKQLAHICSLGFWELSPVSVIAFVHGNYQPLQSSYKVIQCNVWLHWPMSSALQGVLNNTQIMKLAQCWVCVRLYVTAEGSV